MSSPEPPDDTPPPPPPVARPVSRRPEDDEDDDRPRRRRRRDDDDDDERDRRRRRRAQEETDAVVGAFVPVNVSAYALVAFYGGLFGCIPLVGLLAAIPGLVCGIIAIRRWKRSDSYAATTGNARAVIGVALSAFNLLVSGAMLAIVVYAAATGK